MTQQKTLVLGIFMLLLAIPITAQQKAETYTYEMDYLVHTPTSYQTDTLQYPLVIFLHGVGERGDSLNLVKKNGPPMLADTANFPFILVSPQCPNNQYWETPTLNRLLDQLLQNYRINPNRVYLTGLSMGGYGTWAWAQDSPKRFAAIAPVCGGTNTKNAWRIRHIPTRIFHGAKDNVVPAQLSIDMHNALQQAGSTSELTIYPNATHNSWTETYSNPELYEWMLAQKRGVPNFSVSENELKQFIGEYKTADNQVLKVMYVKKQLVLLLGNRELPLVAESNKRFYSGHPTQNMIVFEEIKDGKPKITVKIAYLRMLNSNKTIEAFR